MHRRTLVIGLVAAALVATRARAQTGEQVARVGVLSPAPQPLLDRLIAALSERGWVVGRNLIVDVRYTHGDPQRAESLALQFVAQRVNAIVTNFTATAMAARRVTSTTPIVMATSGFPVVHAEAEIAGPIIEFARRRRIPTMSDFAGGFFSHGGLLVYSPSPAALGRRAAYFVDRILRGANPADLPIEQPSNFDLIINVRTARAIGLTLPPALLAQADQITE